MLAAALVLPAIMGIVSIFLVDPEQRPKGLGGKVGMAVRGYRFTLGLALTLILTTIFAPILKIPPILRRWTSQHVPMVVEEEDYLPTIAEVQKALEAGGWKIERKPASWMIRVPTKVFTTVAGGDRNNLVANNLVNLRAPDLEVALHPADLMISGKEAEVSRARATVAVQLAFSKGYLTWSKEGNQLEDRLRAIWEGLRNTRGGRVRGALVEQLQAVERDIKECKLPYEEWEVLYRDQLLVERGLLQVKAGLVDRPLELTEAPLEAAGAEQISSSSTPRRLIPRAAALALAAGLLWLRLKPRRA
jgi:hypothetical protein